MGRQSLPRRSPGSRCYRRYRFMALCDDNGINSPALTKYAAIAAHPPPQQHVGSPSHPCVYGRRGKAVRIPCPCLPASKRVATTAANRAIVTATLKAADCKNVLECISPVSADLQHAAIEAILRIKIVSKRYLRRLPASTKNILGETSCSSPIVSGSLMKAALGVESAGGFGSPESDVTHVVLDQPGGSAGGVTKSKFSVRSVTGSHEPSTRTASPAMIPRASLATRTAAAAMNSRRKDNRGRDRVILFFKVTAMGFRGYVLSLFLSNEAAAVSSLKPIHKSTAFSQTFCDHRTVLASGSCANARIAIRYICCRQSHWALSRSEN